MKATIFIIFILTALFFSCEPQQTKHKMILEAKQSLNLWAKPAQSQTLSRNTYQWQKITEGANFPKSYNGEMFVVQNKLYYFLSNGIWYSENGKNWQKSELKPLLNTAYQSYVFFKNSFYALGEIKGNYQNLQLNTKIFRSGDCKNWEILAENSNLPKRVFYKTLVFQDKIWLLGGFDGKNYYQDVWNSSDGIHWQQVIDKAPWAARNPGSVIVFQDKIYLMGGGIIDGKVYQDVWQSKDGLHWVLVAEKMHQTISGGGSALVYDDKVWVLGCNRNNGFADGLMYSTDGLNWLSEKAPWSPRGGVSACVFQNKIWMTGGKYSEEKAGEIQFIYSNDIWTLSKKIGRYKNKNHSYSPYNHLNK